MKIIWSPLSIIRIKEIAEFISEDSPEAARKWVDDLFKKVERIEEFPHSGRLVPETGRKDIREILFGNYRIIYRTMQTDIAILTIRHSKQRLPKDDLQ
jgi:plasmid stabilization system protein ParE